MKAHVILSKYPKVTKFTISKIDIQQAQGICKLAEKINETQGESQSPTVIVKLEQ